MTTQRVFLVIGANRSVRVAKKPRLAWDEVAVAVNISYSDGWGKVIGNINLDAPDFDPSIEYVPMEDPS